METTGLRAFNLNANCCAIKYNSCMIIYFSDNQSDC